MRAFFSRYLDSLVSTPTPSASFHDREREGYSFGERYWASLTRTYLPSRGDHTGTNSVRGETGTAGLAVIVRTETRREIGMEEENHPSVPFSGPEFVRQSRREPRRQRNSRRWRVPAIATAVAVAVATAGGVVLSTPGGPLGVGAVPSESAAGNSTAAKSGSAPINLTERATISLPQSGIVGFLPGDTIPVTGEIEAVAPQHHLWLFVRYESGNFYPADQAVDIAGTHWTGYITIRKPSPIAIILADLDPQVYKKLQNDAEFRVEGFSDLRLPPGVTVLIGTMIMVTP